MKHRTPAGSILVLLLCSASTVVPQAKSPIDNMAIEVTGASRTFVYTNKQSAHYYGETSALNSSGWMGFTVYGRKFIDDYLLVVNGEVLERSTALTTTVYPDYLVRNYPGGITEQLRIVDSVAMFAIMVTSPKPVELGVLLLFSDAHSADAFALHLSEGTASLARNNHLMRSAREDFPVWLTVYGKGFLPQAKQFIRGGFFSPVMLAAKRSRTHILSVAVADGQQVAEKLARNYTANAVSYFNKRRGRMERLMSQTAVHTGNARFDMALAWAKLSLDALIMNQVTQGIYAGLPWFNNYWGRDTFISLPGATLVTGRFSEARTLLRSFAAFQMTDSASTDYGRIPNIVTTTSKGYNTADGTPRFVIEAQQYIEHSGDERFLLEIYPTVLRSIDGTIRYHTDLSGFLTHGDAETWMDAVGPDGPWSPRGNRANDIQALWAQQLESGIWFATRVGDVTSARSWYDMLQRLRRNFLALFIVNGAMADRLKPDGSPDMTLRPNQIFASFLLDDTLRARVVRTVMTKLTYQYGVASLSQEDGNFHPYHEAPQLYPKDAAYHNGTVWTWLQGALIAELCRFGKQDVAARLTMNTVHQILDRGAVGSQSELLDAITRPGEKEPRLSGTVLQAWNLAEFIRNFYEDYLGARVDLLTHTMTLRPRIPEIMGKVSARLNLDGRALDLEFQKDEEFTAITITTPALNQALLATISLTTARGRIVETSVTIPAGTKIRLELHGERVTVTASGHRDVASATKILSGENFDENLGALNFAAPTLRPGLKALQGPGFPVLSNSEVKAVNPSARVLVDASDPTGDDIGTGHYTYPTNPNFLPGILDITHFRVAYDSLNVYFTINFRALANPGWHPEYGYQLTYTAIAIDEDGVRGSGNVIIGQNSNYTLDSLHAFERIIFVGGGIRIEDNAGAILAAYTPAAPDVSNPLGSASTGIISFAVPIALIGTPEASWTFTLLSGAQDDHGGAGLGEFRTVAKDGGEWNGGGKMRPDDPNVYDTLIAPAR
jgi:glycogen debranching enzyme